MSEIYKQLAAPFPVDEIEWRVGSTNAKSKPDGPFKGQALAYIDSRAVMDRLDDVVGPEGWQCRYPYANGKTCCEIAILHEGQWVWKADGAGDTDFEGAKGAFSDSFKRAAVKWGIGRYLYEVDAPWVEIEKRGNSFTIPDHEKRKLSRILAKHDGTKLGDLQEQTKSFIKQVKDAPDAMALNTLWKQHETTLLEPLELKLPSWFERVQAVVAERSAELNPMSVG